MAKLSIGLRGWRFDETEVFTDDGEMRPLMEMSEATRGRLVRLTVIAGNPCDACWLIHGDEELRRCREAAVVYGEPLAEVVLCEPHERDFLYWFREAGGSAYRGSERFKAEFRAWFANGERAPTAYEGIEHVDTDPDAVPAVQPDEAPPALEDAVEEMDPEELEALDISYDDLDV
jgi:hypothetical protein